jgi:hypothetical protein
MGAESRVHWEQYGDFVYNHGRGSDHDYESRWP